MPVALLIAAVTLYISVVFVLIYCTIPVFGTFYVISLHLRISLAFLVVCSFGPWYLCSGSFVLPLNSKQMEKATFTPPIKKKRNHVYFVGYTEDMYETLVRNADFKTGFDMIVRFDIYDRFGHVEPQICLFGIKGHLLTNFEYGPGYPFDLGSGVEFCSRLFKMAHGYSLTLVR